MTACHAAVPVLLVGWAHSGTVSFWICSKW